MELYIHPLQLPSIHLTEHKHLLQAPLKQVNLTNHAFTKILQQKSNKPIMFLTNSYHTQLQKPASRKMSQVVTNFVFTSLD